MYQIYTLDLVPATIRSPESLPPAGDEVDAHVWAQNVGDHDRTVGLLIILHYGDPGTAHSEPRTVQRVHEIAFAAALGLVADTGTAGLERFAIRAGGYLAEFVARGQPDFKVVRFRGSKTHVAGTEQHGPKVQPEFLENRFGIAYQRFVLLVAFFRMGELEQLDLLKLMLAQDAARVFARRTGFRAEARGPCSKLNR